MEMHEYSPGEVVPVTSSLYRVVHDPPKKGEHLQTFYAGDQFPSCVGCGKKVRYLIQMRVLRRHAAKVIEDLEPPLPPEE